jgi:hypothetical protein
MVGRTTLLAETSEFDNRLTQRLIPEEQLSSSVFLYVRLIIVNVKVKVHSRSGHEGSEKE